MVINMEFDTVYGEFEKHTSIKGDFERIIYPLNRTVLIDTNYGSADNKVILDLKTGKDILKGSQFYPAFKKQKVKSTSRFYPKINNNK